MTAPGARDHRGATRRDRRRGDPRPAARAAALVRSGRRHERRQEARGPLGLRRALAKRELRFVAVDDGAFTRRHRTAPLVALAAIAPGRIEDVAIGRCSVDGVDATDRVAELVLRLRPWSGTRLVVLDGIAFAGFNLVDLPRLARRLGRPVLAVTPRAPDLPRIRDALAKYFPRDFRPRWRRVRAALPRRVVGPGGPLWVASAGIAASDRPRVLERLVPRGRWPEALTVAHRIARAVRPPIRANRYGAGRRRRPGPVA